MSLKSAELAGINVPPSAMDGAVRFIKSVSAGQFGGKASYRPGERPSRPMTAEALVCRQFLGMARDNPAGDEAGEYISADLPRHGSNQFVLLVLRHTWHVSVAGRTMAALERGAANHACESAANRWRSSGQLGSGMYLGRVRRTRLQHGTLDACAWRCITAIYRCIRLPDRRRLLLPANINQRA